jgi:hypothetical protein
MEKTLINKMIRNCLTQYGYGAASVPLSEQDYENLSDKILTIKAQETSEDLYAIIHDVVYEYLTQE